MQSAARSASSKSGLVSYSNAAAIFSSEVPARCAPWAVCAWQ
jgi:hypothetical protein